MYQRLTAPTLLVAVVLGTVVLNLFCLGRYPAIGGDEVIIGSCALNLLRHGTLADPIYHGSGLPLADYYPPVAPILVAVSYAAFGFGVIQTKLPGLILGIATAVLLFIVAARIAGRGPAVIATLVFVLDPVTFATWQSGRDDAYFVFAVSASMFAGSCAIGGGRGRLRVLWFLAGLFTGLAGAAYYPFAAIAIFISVLVLWALVWREATLSINDKATASGCFVVGLASVLIAVAVWMSSHIAYCREQVLGMAPDYLSRGSAIRAILGEWRRYWEYAMHEAGLPNLALGLAAVAMIPWATRRSWELAPALVAVIGCAGFLTVYAEKDSRYLATMVFLGCIGLAVVCREIDSGRFPELGRWLVRPLVCLSVVAGLLRVAIVAFTLIYQWQGRDYRAFNAELRALIPHDARAIGPQTVWYALADDKTDLWLYTQGGRRFAAIAGENAMDEASALANITYVIIDKHQTAGRLSGLQDYVRGNFQFVASVGPDFAPLPWAKVPPLDVEIYSRVR